MSGIVNVTIELLVSFDLPKGWSKTRIRRAEKGTAQERADLAEMLETLSADAIRIGEILDYEIRDWSVA